MDGFQKDIFRGYLIKADLNGALQYLRQFPDKQTLFEKYQSLFEKEQYIAYDVEAELERILLIYQKYYRDALYLNIPAEDAAQTMLRRLKDLLNVSDPDITMEQLEDTTVAQAFTQRGYSFLGGQTSGFYGPYIWKTTERKVFSVDLPNGTQEYTVQFMDGFVCRSWMDYISFGAVGTGGWTDENGLICCVKSAYDMDSEAFRVSLLKHEAQHAMDCAVYGGLSSQELEYRAKLVELIYSRKRNLWKPFLLGADATKKRNGHALASQQIVCGYERLTGLPRAQLEALSIAQIQDIALKLFTESSTALQAKEKKIP